MKYMTFNSSCSYAGVANMLERYGLDVEDRQIALEMGLPFLFSVQDGIYCSGPMLQTAEWFNLYLQPKGFSMIETDLSRKEVPAFLEGTVTAMLGMKGFSRGKHAVIYKGREGEHWKFLNNKSEKSLEPENLVFSQEELMERLDGSVRVATLQGIPPVEVDLKPYFQKSVQVLSQLKQDIIAFSGSRQTPQDLRAAQNTLFRAILLDGITMMELLGNTELTLILKSIQKDFMAALRENVPVTLADQISIPRLESAIDAYLALIPASTKEMLDKSGFT